MSLVLQNPYISLLVFILVALLLFLKLWCVTEYFNRKFDLNAFLQEENDDSDKSTQISSLSSQDLDISYNSQQDNCVICLQNNCNLITNCGHYFHFGCLTKWIKLGKNCPLCKSGYSYLILVCLTCKIQGRLFWIHKQSDLKSFVKLKNQNYCQHDERKSRYSYKQIKGIITNSK